MKSKKQVVKINVPAKIDVAVIKESKMVAKQAGFRFFNNYVEAALKDANKKVKSLTKKTVVV